MILSLYPEIKIYFFKFMKKLGKFNYYSGLKLDPLVISFYSFYIRSLELHKSLEY